MAKPSDPQKFALTYTGGIRAANGTGGVDWVMGKIEEIVEGGGQALWVTDWNTNKIEVGPGPQYRLHQNHPDVQLTTQDLMLRLRRRNYQDKENP